MDKTDSETLKMLKLETRNGRFDDKVLCRTPNQTKTKTKTKIKKNNEQKKKKKQKKSMKKRLQKTKAISAQNQKDRFCSHTCIYVILRYQIGARATAVLRRPL